MTALEFWKRVVDDKSEFLERLVGLLAEYEIRYCIIDGVAANAYTEPLISLDMDIVIAGDDLSFARDVLQRSFEMGEIAGRLSLTAEGSRLRVQVHTGRFYSEYVSRATVRDVLGLRLPVAALEDVLAGKIRAFRQPHGRASDRTKDLVDIARLFEAYPYLEGQMPRDILHMVTATP